MSEMVFLGLDIMGYSEPIPKGLGVIREGSSYLPCLVPSVQGSQL